jgi:glycerol uptake facilitator-like aquaporin
MSSTFRPRPAERAATTAPATTRRPDRGTSPPLGPRLAAEFIGTFFLVVTVCAAINPKTGAGPLAPLAIGSILMAMVFAGGHISGGHYNPAVSFAVMIRGKLTAGEWLCYTATQLGAGTAGGLAARSIAGVGRPETTATSPPPGAAKAIPTSASRSASRWRPARSPSAAFPAPRSTPQSPSA